MPLLNDLMQHYAIIKWHNAMPHLNDLMQHNVAIKCYNGMPLSHAATPCQNAMP
jgi:hypothetical protein